MRLTLSTWPAVEAYRERSKGVIVPVGSTEQHGPNGPIGTDAICAERVAAGVGEEVGALVGPTLTLGMAQHHLAFPGTVTLRPTTFIAVIGDVVASLAIHGFQRIYFLNGHGGNVAPLSTAFSEIYAARSGLRLRTATWWEGEEVKSLTESLFGKAEGRHATPSEISLAWFAHPEAVVDVPMPPASPDVGPIRDAQDFRARFADGRIGSDPTLASVDAGRRLYEAAVRDVSADYRVFLTEA
jgi:creatinine amidohydrolase